VLPLGDAAIVGQAVLHQHQAPSERSTRRSYLSTCSGSETEHSVSVLTAVSTLASGKGNDSAVA